MILIVCKERELRSRRPKILARKLRPVADNFVRVDPDTKNIVWHLTAGSGGQSTIVGNKKTFPSYVNRTHCEYRELWIPIDRNQKQFRLDNVQFQLYQIDDSGSRFREIMAFHWHLGNNQAAERTSHARKPHFHVSIASSPIDRSHLNVTLAVNDDDQNNMHYLDKLLDDAIDLMASEVLARLEKSPLDGS